MPEARSNTEDLAAQVNYLRDRLAELKARPSQSSVRDPARLTTASVPPALEPAFLKAQQFVEAYFRQRIDDPERSTISIAGERYILVRAASMSVEFFDLVLSLYQDRGPREARSVANNLLFDIAHAIGRADARSFHEKMGVTDPVERLSAGPIHFSFSGWAFVKILPESRPSPDQNFLIVYDHPFSFESDAWITRDRKSEAPVCIMNAGYSSGWCEESFRIPLVAVEVQCRARGDPHCRFIMAPPSRIEERVADYRRQSGAVPLPPRAEAEIRVPEFFQRKRLEDQIRASHEELEQRVWARTAELAKANRALEETIRHREIMEEQLLKAQKMEGIGRLAGGVAHDFNNLLAAIIGYDAAARTQLPADHPAQEQLRGIAEAAQRATDLTRELLTFARRQPLHTQSMDLNGLVERSRKMIEMLSGERIRVEVEAQPDLWQVVADPGQFERVLVNLAVNARDAMPSGGTLTIRTANTTLGKDHVARYPDAFPGEHIALSVADTGSGMTPEVLARIFEPFYTTKGAGKGTGLGLATCYGIVRQHGGHITVDSRPGKGSTFSVYLPRAGTTPHPALAETPQFEGHVLVVEDQSLVLELAKQILEGHGFTVLTASDGPAALHLAQSQPDLLRLLIADLNLPRLSGLELAIRLRSTQPKLPVILVSGYSGPQAPPEVVLQPGMLFLAKPFTPDALISSVHEALSFTSA